MSPPASRISGRLLRATGMALLIALPAWTGFHALQASGIRHSCIKSRPIVRSPGHVLYGVQLNWPNDQPQTYAQRLGHVPAIYGIYAGFPISRQAQPGVTQFACRAAALGASVMITLGLDRSLSTVTPRSALALALFLRDVSRTAPVFLRFGWEMNGSWYSWGQQPQAYIRAFREIADAIHRHTRDVSMVWSPNIGTGYPFPNGTYSPPPGSRRAKLLDTNHDGVLDSSDDPYAPYYPGNRYVDAVGLTLTYFGRSWPWTQNVTPQPGLFTALLTGTFHENGARQIPNFYASYSVAKRKPFMITETSALYLPQVKTGATQLQIKQAWWRQVYAADIPRRFPNLDAILWFEDNKYEPGQHEYISWAVTYNPQIRTALRRDLPHWLIWSKP
jgi:hypothetical protein